MTQLASIGKGGVVSLPPFTLPAGQAASAVGETVTLATNRGRFTGTKFERVQIQASGDLDDPNQLRRLSLSIIVNGRSLPTVQDVTLDVLWRSPLELEHAIPDDANVQATLTVIESLTTVADNTLAVRLWGMGLIADTAGGPDRRTQIRDGWRK